MLKSLPNHMQLRNIKQRCSNSLEGFGHMGLNKRIKGKKKKEFRPSSIAPNDR